MLNLNDLKECINYCPDTGEIFNKLRKRKVIVEDGYFVVFVQGVRHKLQASATCWRIAYDKDIPEGYRVLHRNLNTEDRRLKNLLLLDRKTYNKIYEAFRNLHKHLRVIPHSVDKHCLLIKYTLNNVPMSSLHHDPVTCNKELQRLRVRFAKILNKYCVFD